MTFLNYLLQANLYLSIFYLFYSLVLKTETFFTLNRFYLLSSAALSLLIPALSLDWVQNFLATQKVRETTESFIVMAEPVVLTPLNQQNNLTVLDTIQLIYLLGLLFFGLRFLVRFYKVTNHKIEQTPAWSFFRKTVVSERLDHRETILSHERVHAEQLHSADVIFSELFAILCWFNPVIYLYKKAVKHIHEFIADEHAAADNKAEYATLLLSHSLGIQPSQLVNSFFNSSLLKQRIFMLSKNRSKKAAMWKYGLSAPLLVLMLIFSAASINAREVNLVNKAGDMLTTTADLLNPEETPEFSQQPLPQQNESKRNNLTGSERTERMPASQPEPSLARPEPTQTDSLYTMAKLEVLPEYPGGVDKFREFIGRNYSYPKEAADKKIGGRVIVQFVIEKDGSLTNTKVLRDIGYGTGEEAERVIKMSPKWNPGVQNGRPVRVSYVIPFALTPPSVKPVLTISGPENPAEVLYLIDGKESSYEEAEKLEPSAIERIEVIKDETKFKEYKVPEGKKAIVIISLKKN